MIIYGQLHGYLVDAKHRSWYIAHARHGPLDGPCPIFLLFRSLLVDYKNENKVVPSSFCRLVICAKYAGGVSAYNQHAICTHNIEHDHQAWFRWVGITLIRVGGARHRFSEGAKRTLGSSWAPLDMLNGGYVTMIKDSQRFMMASMAGEPPLPGFS